MAILDCCWYSEKLMMNTKALVIVPQEKDPHAPWPVLYLLHGRGQNYMDWERYTNVERYAQKYSLVIVMPDVQRSFYMDLVYGIDYFSYITQELPQIVESMFSVSRKAQDRYIAGLSMGGYGCLKAALSRPDFYHAVGSLSAVTDMAMHIEREKGTIKEPEFKAYFGEKLELPEESDLKALAQKAAAGGVLPKIYLACGTKDPSHYPECSDFDAILTGLGIDHRFEAWVGRHDWDFWDTGIRKIFQFFFGS